MASRIARRRIKSSASAAASRAGCPVLRRGDLWIFGYGSLMWDPGFEHARAVPALLRGYHRAFCVYSLRYRGTPERPGLVLGLDRGGACRGVAFRVARARADEALALLWAREMPRLVYTPRIVPVQIENARVPALVFIADPAHESYAGKLEIGEMARIIASGRGARGANLDYLQNTLRHLHALGIRDRPLHQLLDAALRICVNPAEPTVK